MKSPLFRVIAVVTFLFCLPLGRSETITLSLLATNYQTPTSKVFSVPSNILAQIVWVRLPTFDGTGQIDLAFPSGASFRFSLSDLNSATANLPLIAGPATITLSAWVESTTSRGVPAACTIQTSSSTSFSPSTAVVIPNDGAGPVNIILESSVDLTTWTPAMPGTYGTTSSNRFFRVRAQR